VYSAFDVTGRTVVVTGASRGLGRAMAIAFGEAGANVVLTGRDGQALEDARRATEKAGGRTLAVTMEVTDRAAVDRAAQQTVDTFGTIDVLVNNAGIVKVQPFLEVTDADIARLLDVNLVGAVRCCQAFGRVMVDRKRGKIVNVSSIGGIIGRTYGEVAYAATKAGLIGLTRCLAVEWARYNVCVNAVCPGVFRTEMNDHVFADAKLREQVERRIAFRRLGAPQELAPTVLFLASSASDFMTGEAIVVDGGETVR
jgi:2-deoxy-D-gluconate 3-dehydrogenase